MKNESQAPREGRMTENVWIPGADGRRLAARIWLPGTLPAAAILEAHPYRKRDFWRPLDEIWAPHLSAAGFAFVRLDLRGSGDSEGVLADEYLEIEHADLLAVIDWLAKQPWCTGAVGLRGTSWGGIEALQVAALRPAPLKAVIAHCATDDRFGNECHYVGGALGLANFEWGLLFRCFTLMPPDPMIAGASWQRRWQERLDAASPILATWLSHQQNDRYWRHGSVAVDYDRIDVPVWITSGWLDAYVDTVPRLLANLKAPVRGLIGPWGHSDPLFASPGPGIDWVHQEIAWWNRWLRGHAPTGSEAPQLSVFVTHGAPAAQVPHPIRGHWVEFQRWPSARIGSLILYPNAGGLRRAPATAGWCEVSSAVVGLGFRHWLNLVPALELLADDQAADDRRSLTFDTEPLDADIDLLGCAELCTQVRCDRPVAQLAARLCDVGPDGSSALVSWSVLNLTHRYGSASPQPLVPDASTLITLAFRMRAHRFRKGHRIRLAISQGLWPLAWPAPRATRLEIDIANTALALPFHPTEAVAGESVGGGGDHVPASKNAEVAAPSGSGPSGTVHCRIEGPDPEGRARVVEEVRLHRPNARGSDLRISRVERWELETTTANPAAGSWRGRIQFELAWPSKTVEVAAEFSLQANERSFKLVESCRAADDGTECLARSWRHEIPRELL